MAVVYSDDLKKDRLDKVTEHVDAGADEGVLVIGTSALDGVTGVLAEIPLDDPSFAAAAGTGTVSITLEGVPLEANATAGGTAAKAELRDSDGNVIVSGLTVGTSGADIIITSTTIVNGQPVRVTSGTITHG